MEPHTRILASETTQREPGEMRRSCVPFFGGPRHQPSHRSPARKPPPLTRRLVRGGSLDLRLGGLKGQVGQWHFGKRRPISEDHEEQEPGLAGLDATLASRCRGASYPRSRPGSSRWLEPALKPLFSRAVRTVAWNAIRGCGCRCRAARRVTPEKSPGRRGPARTLPSRWAGRGRERLAEEPETRDHLTPLTPSIPAPSPTLSRPSPASRARCPQGCAGTRRSVRSTPSRPHPSLHA